MAIRWQEVHVAKRPRKKQRPAFDGQRQRDALEKLQQAAGIDATVAARLVSLSYPQYNRYLWGTTPLRTDQLAAFAAAYGVTRAELSRALGLMDDEQTSELTASVREALGCTALVGGRVGERQMEDRLGQLSDEDREHILRTVAEVLSIRRGDPEA